MCLWCQTPKPATLCYSLRSLTVSVLTFMPLTHLAGFGSWCEAGAHLHCLARGRPAVSAPFVETPFSPRSGSVALLKGSCRRCSSSLPGSPSRGLEAQSLDRWSFAVSFEKGIPILYLVIFHYRPGSLGPVAILRAFEGWSSRFGKKATGTLIGIAPNPDRRGGGWWWWCCRLPTRGLRTLGCRATLFRSPLPPAMCCGPRRVSLLSPWSNLFQGFCSGRCWVGFFTPFPAAP